MDENKREYSVVGTVTIGTDEYRDLLTEKFEAEREKNEWHEKWYTAYCDKGKVEKECEKLREELDRLKKFISKNKSLIDEDSIAIFMAMFEEE